MFFDFVDSFSREVWKKKLYFRLSLFFFFTTLVFFFLWLFSPSPMTPEDAGRLYLCQRLNYTPSTVERAFSSPFEYRLFGDVVKEREVRWVRENEIYSLFVPLSVKREGKDVLVAEGVRVLFTPTRGVIKEERKRYYLRIVEGKFLLSEKGGKKE